MKRKLNKKIWIGPVCLFLIMAVFAVIPFMAIAADTIKIGVLEPLSGAMESIGRSALAGLRFVVDEQNAKGGLLGKKIELIVEDDEFKPDVATRKARSLILKDGVDFIAAAAGSHISIALAKVAEAEKKLLFHYASTADVIMGKEFTRYAFRTAVNNYSYTSAMVRYLANKPYRRFYFISMDYVASRDITDDFRKQIKARIPDAKFVGDEYHPIGTKDFAPYITKIIAAGPDMVYLGTMGADLINLVKQCRSLGLKSDFMTHLIYDPYMLMGLKDDAVGIYFANPYELRVKTPENEAMVAKYHEQHKKDKDFLTWWPCGLVGNIICGWKMNFAAVEKAGSLDAEKIISTYEGFSYQTPIGLYTMRKCDHQVIAPMFVGRIEGGWNPYFNGSINPEVKFPWAGSNIVMIPAEDVTIPATSDYNPRCP